MATSDAPAITKNYHDVYWRIMRLTMLLLRYERRNFRFCARQFESNRKRADRIFKALTDCAWNCEKMKSALLEVENHLNDLPTWVQADVVAAIAKIEGRSK